jgi:hypothetical protein
MRKHFIDTSFLRSRHAIFDNAAKRDQVGNGSFADIERVQRNVRCCRKRGHFQTSRSGITQHVGGVPETDVGP